ncbi:hypothetical protein NCCP2222_14950 [Sporosarcina sp. NCCP-2222]|uniref:DUF503 domain-containing protein n=1 Tax=Sporosarcina sp. NCCP-2222 TaxID=2935073 RepID=UPI00207E9DD9|nr:DUF503 domain-containing protein [Sporosarcina sp. NCCP-2222]GKV55548.1 hypothetical protein NCCP2222_14950 [Sporosarcina sp. NCCP-2222]
MIVYAECSFFIPDINSLKGKRSVLQRMMERVKNDFNVSVAEIDYQDLWQRTVIALVCVASAKEPAEGEVRRAIRFLESNPEWELTDLQLEYY